MRQRYRQSHDALEGVSVGGFVPRKEFQYEEAGGNVVEELRRAIGERIHQVVKVDAAMILLQDGLGCPIQDFAHMRDVFAEGAEIGQSAICIRRAELLEDFTGLGADFLWRNRSDELLNGVGWQSVVTHDKEMEDGSSKTRAEGNDGDGLGRAAQVVKVVPIDEDLVRRDDYVSNEPL